MSIGGENLPECLIEKIFSYLSYKEATKLSLVSKTWLQAWFTCPNLKFKVGYYRGNVNVLLVDKVMKRYRERKIPIDKFTLSISCYNKFRHILVDKWLDIALQNGVKDVVCEVDYEFTFPISTFLASKSTSLRELDLRGCDLMNNLSLLSTSTTTTTKCHSLRKLSLYHVCLDNNMLQTLINCCPFIVDLTIEACPLLTKIKVKKNLQYIKSVCISPSFSYQISFVQIQAPTLQHLEYSGSTHHVLAHDLFDINIECRNLKSLKLSYMKVSEGLLRHLMKVSEVLETLTLYCVRGEWNICGSQSLKDLKIAQSKDNIIGVIDAPNLVSLEYVGGQIPDLKITKDQLNNSQANIRCFIELIDATWFLKLRIFLSNLTSWSRISLRFNEWNEIDMNDLQLRDHMHHSVIIIPQVIVLDVHLEFEDIITSSCPIGFVDALLWSCRPRRLNLYSTSVEIITCFMDRLMYVKNSSHSTPQLKEVKAYKVISEQYETVELIVVKNWP